MAEEWKRSVTPPRTVLRFCSNALGLALPQSDARKPARLGGAPLGHAAAGSGRTLDAQAPRLAERIDEGRLAVERRDAGGPGCVGWPGGNPRGDRTAVGRAWASDLWNASPAAPPQLPRTIPLPKVRQLAFEIVRLTRVAVTTEQLNRLLRHLACARGVDA